MPTTNWGMLAKSQTDSETIEEAIARLITAHNANADSHLATGQSLQSHKASAIIDHLALSIVEDKIGDGEISLQKLTALKRVILSAFESLDGWATFGNVILDFANVKIYTDTVLNAYSGMTAVPTNWTGLDWDKECFWQSTVKLLSISAVQAYFGLGGTDHIGGFSSAGFYVDDGDLYCYHAVDSGGGYSYTTEQITGITLTNWNTFRILFNPTAGTLKFYVNGVLEHTFDSSLPTSDTGEFAMFQIQTTDTVKKTIIASDLLVSVAR